VHPSAAHLRPGTPTVKATYSNQRDGGATARGERRGSMSGYFKYIGIYQTELIRSGPTRVVIDPVKIEFFQGPKVYRIPLQIARVVPKGTDAPLARDGELHLAPSKYIAITVRTEEVNPAISRPFCENKLHETIATLSLIHNPGLFAHKEYEGWLLEATKVVVGGWFTARGPVDIQSNLEEVIRAMRHQQGKDADTAKRFALLSRFFAKSLSVDPGEELFFYLWTMLEIFPMKDTSDIKPVRKLLAEMTGRTTDDVEKSLNIGRLCGTRSDLVHEGELRMPVAELGETTDRLKLICTEVLRHMSGMAYSGSLDKYFKPA